MSYFSEAEKLACVQRELSLRRQVYPRRIQNGQMSANQARHELACMEAIVADYQATAREAARTAGDPIDNGAKR